MNRVSKHNYYLDIAQTVSERATCLRRRFGAIIVKNDTIISTGYNAHLLEYSSFLEYTIRYPYNSFFLWVHRYNQ